MSVNGMRLVVDSWFNVSSKIVPANGPGLTEWHGLIASSFQYIPMYSLIGFPHCS